MKPSAYFLQALLDCMSEGVVVIDTTGIVSQANLAVERILGYAQQELQGKNVSCLMPEPDASRHDAYLARYQAGGQAGIIGKGRKVTARHKNGQPVPIQLEINEFIHGTKRYFVGVMQDLNQNVMLTQKMSSIFEASAGPVAVLNADFRFAEFNPAWTSLTGISSQELLVQNFVDLFLEAFQEPMRLALVNLRRQGGTASLESRLTSADGQNPWILWSITYSAEQALYFVTGVSITERKQTEESLLKSQQSLNEAQKLAHIGNWEYTPSRGELIWSEELYRIFELEDQLNESLYQAYRKRCHPDDLALLESTFEQSLATGKDYQIEHRIIRNDGTIKYLCCLGEPIKNEKGQIIGLKGTSQDISKQKLIAASLEEAIAKAQAANLTKDAFLANMSHELRTPLTGILGMADLLLQEIPGQLNTRQVKSLETIQQSGQHLLNLINDILDLSKIEAGMLEILLEPTEAEKIAREALSVVKQMANQKEIRLALQVEPFDLQILTDTRHLKQILVNLLSNAIKFTSQQGQVSLSICMQDTSVKIEVCDTGIGISPENLKKLFQPFVQIDSKLARQSTGTGLGLNMVKHLVEAHGGTIHVSSEEGQGSCFSVLLPQPKEQKNSLQTDLQQLEKTHQKATHNARILLIDDNPVNIDVIQTFLEHMNYLVEPVTCGKDALSWLEQEVPDLVLMDIQMPEMDGFELIQRLRQSSRKQVAELPVVALTSLAMNGDQERIMKQGFDAYMSKPVDLTGLKCIIETLISTIQNERCL